MGITLSKGGQLSLSKEAPGLDEVTVGLGWDARGTSGTNFDLDACAFLLAASGRVRSDADFIFYNQLRSADGSVEHTGDNRTGEGDGDDEQLIVRLERVPSDVVRIAITVSIHEAQLRRQSFGMVDNAFVRIVDNRNGREVVRYDLTDDFSDETALVFGELRREGGEWRFTAVGEGHAGGLEGLATSYGVDIA